MRMSDARTTARKVPESAQPQDFQPPLPVVQEPAAPPILLDPQPGY